MAALRILPGCAARLGALAPKAHQDNSLGCKAQDHLARRVMSAEGAEEEIRDTSGIERPMREDMPPRFQR
jgi:hypothetical protein